MDRSGAGLLSGRWAESTLHKGTVQKSQSAGKVGQQEGVPRGWDTILGGEKSLFFRWVLKCFDLSSRWYLCYVDVTAVCILEAFQNQQSMLLADKVLKQLGKEKAKDKYKVRVQSTLRAVCLTTAQKYHPKCWMCFFCSEPGANDALSSVHKILF